MTRIALVAGTSVWALVCGGAALHGHVFVALVAFVGAIAGVGVMQTEER